MGPVASTTTSPTGRPPPMSAAQAFQRLDSGSKGYLSVDDLKQAGPPPERDSVQISAKGAAASAGATGAADPAGRPDAAAVFARMDSDGNGQVTVGEFKAAAPAQRPGSSDGDGDTDGGADAATAGVQTPGPSPARSGAGAAPARAARGGDGDGDGGGGRAAAGSSAKSSAGASSASSSSTTYEPADANRDGKVSQPEQQAYDIQQAQTRPAAPAAQLQPQAAQALKAYAEVATGS